ncbi:MAG: Zinc carboxypeptidase precursor [Acidobacteria bacterium ADurb.Bin051]|nr:MAG: Zinc carboxypeptidase precursor [Acidobacteria bacterium ADurb.Bin051]
MRTPALLLTAALTAVLLLCLPVAASANDPFAGSGPWMVRVYLVPDAERTEILERFGDFGVERKSGTIRLHVDDREGIEWLRARGYRVEVEEETTAAMRAAERLAAAGTQAGGIPGYPCYRTVEESYAAAAALVAARPDLAALVDIGDSWEKATPGGAPGYDLLVLVLTNQAIPGPKPRFFLHGAIHAREYTTVELGLRFAEELVAGYGTDADATWLLDEHEIHLLIQANPDGRKQAETGLSWRKNTNGNYCGPASNSRGADLNRNFEFKWGCCGGSSTNPCDDTYRGAAPASEPETMAIQAYMRTIFPDQRGPLPSDPAPADATGLYIDLHSYSELVLWPWGYTYSAAPNGTALQTLGRKFAWFNGYEPDQSVGLYPTDGSTDDFAYGDLGIAAYTFELGTAFFQSCSVFEQTILPDNLPALRYAAKVARTPYLTPAGPDVVAPGVTPAVIAPGETAVLTATLDDTRFSTVNGVEPTQAIAAGSYYLDTPPWRPGAVARPLAAVDGLFDQKVEAVSANVDTTGLAPGRHTLYLQGTDAAGSAGAVSAVFLWVIDPMTAPVVTGHVRDAVSHAGLAATVVAGPFSTATDPVTGAYELQVPEGTWDLRASAPEHVPATVTGVVLGSSQVHVEEFALTPIVTFFADDVEQGNTGWTAQTPWAITTEAAHSPTHSWTDSPGTNYGNYADTSLTSPVLDLSAAHGVELVYAQRYDTESGWDFCRVEISTGGAWSEVARFSGNATTWQTVTLPLPQLEGVATARFRFRLTSDGSVQRNGWWVDDIVVRGFVDPELDDLFADGFESGDTSRWSGKAP